MDNVKKIETPYNNAVSIINRTNQLLLENNVKDSTGEAIAQLEEAVDLLQSVVNELKAMGV